MLLSLIHKDNHSFQNPLQDKIKMNKAEFKILRIFRYLKHNKDNGKVNPLNQVHAMILLGRL